MPKKLDRPLRHLKYLVLVVTVVGSTVYGRFFFRVLCPMGALNGIVGKVSPFKVVRIEAACIHCDRCSKNCPANIAVAHEMEVTSAECFNCQTCVLEWPAAGALVLKRGRRR